MSMTFQFAQARATQKLPWGELARLSGPQETSAKDLTIMEVLINEGGGHSFHYHPDQEELIYVVSGRIEQWLERESKLLGPGDAIFIPRAKVHASFNVFAEPARVLAILGPCSGPDGYRCVDVFEQAPWNTLKQRRN